MEHPIELYKEIAIEAVRAGGCTCDEIEVTFNGMKYDGKSVEKVEWMDVAHDDACHMLMRRSAGEN